MVGEFARLDSPDTNSLRDSFRLSIVRKEWIGSVPMKHTGRIAHLNDLNYLQPDFPSRSKLGAVDRAAIGIGGDLEDSLRMGGRRSCSECVGGDA